jgi:hypothetical protein
LIAETGFEPSDLWVMDQTSYQTAPLRVPPHLRVRPAALRFTMRLTDGDRTRNLRSHNSREMVSVCPDVSVGSADLRVFLGCRGRWLVHCVPERISPVAVRLQCIREPD